MTVIRLNRSFIVLAIVLSGPGAAVALDDGASPPPAARERIAREDGALAAAAPEGAGVETGVPAPVVATENKPVIQTLGEADQKIFVVDHGGTWSMHFENVITANVVRLWQSAGGPEVTTKQPVDRTYTMSVHRLQPELILERLFEGYGYTLHYDDDGRLTSVRVYSPRDSEAFKTPRLTESLSQWKEVESGAAQPAQP